MAIRFSKKYIFIIAIQALLAGFSDYSFALSGWASVIGVAGKCYGSQYDACGAGTWSSSYPGYSWTGGIVFTSPNYYCHAEKWVSGVVTNLNVQLQTCAKTCTSPQIIGSTGDCETPLAPSDCGVGKVWDSASNSCIVPDTCPSGQTMLYTTGSNGVRTAGLCVANVPTPDGPCVTYEDNQTSSCQQKQQDCTSTGGTFGNINGQNVCIPPGPAQPPPCASGSSQFTQNSDGSKSATCVGPANIQAAPTDNSPGQPIATNTTAATSTAQQQANIANNTAATAQIAQSGFQAVVNAVNNNTAKSAAGGGGNGSSAAQDKSNSDGVISAINANTASEHGAGQCDPHSSTYADCIKETETAPDADGSSIRANAITEGNASIDSAADSVVTGINAASAQSAPDTSSFTDTLKSYLPQGESCSDLLFTVHGYEVVVSCDRTALVREWGAWAFALFSMWSIFEIMFRRPV